MVEVITGSIISYLYKADDSLYKVAKIETKDSDEIIIVGNFLELEEGLEYEFVGSFIEHSKYGRQFKVESYTKANSFSEEGLIAYLSSDKFYGIGPKLAKNIVDELGLDCIDQIMKNPDCLDSVYQMTKAKKGIISEVLSNNYATEQVFIKLFSYGLTSKMIYKLYEVYNTDAVTRIEENPYRLIYEVDGYGFKKCDLLAMKLGIKENDKLRIEEAVRYTLNVVCYQQGFTFLNYNQLCNSTLNLLNNNSLILNSDLDYALETLIENDKIIKEEERYFDAALYKAEADCANRINKNLANKIKLYKSEEIKAKIKIVEQDLSIKYTDLQVEAITKALSSKISIITGGPGTGKSTIINGIIRCYALLNDLVFPSEDLDSKIILMAPTGRAAKRMTEVTNFKAATIHKTLGYNYEGSFNHNSECPLYCSLAIVDETSMIDINLASSMFKALPLKSQIILVGDENQLPSVGPGNVFHDLIASNLFTTVKLYEVMRQAADSNIIKLSNMIYSGKIDFRIFGQKKEVYFYPCDTTTLKDILFRLLDAYVEHGNDIQNGMQILIPMYAGVAGIDSINQAITNRYNSSTSKIVRDNLIIKENDKVLQLKNDPELNLMNGDIGIVKGFITLKEKDYIMINFEGKMVTYPVKEIDNLRLAYAISIHKSQGSEYDNVVLPILPSYYMMLRKKIIYTGVTRAKKKLIILGNLETLQNAITNLEQIRQTGLLDKLSNKYSANETKIFDASIPFDTFGEYDMDGITPYSFME